MKQNRRILITAGHQGIGTGAQNNGYDEGKEAIILRDLVTAELTALGFKVINDGDKDSLPKVLAWLNKQYNAKDILVDIHFNASVSSQATGTEVFVAQKSTELENEIAEKIGWATSDLLKIRNRGVKVSSLTQHKTIGILDKTKLTCCLWEVCFLSNLNDFRNYQTNQKELAKAIANILAEYAAA